MVTWFLTENQEDKLVQSICNCLSIGQFELARSLVRIYFEERRLVSEADDGRVQKIIREILTYGPPDSWVCSRSVPSTAHLLCMCGNILRDMSEDVESAISRRVEFDCMLVTTLIEGSNVSNTWAAMESANELRIRYGLKLLSDESVSSLSLPRILMINYSDSLAVLSGIQLSNSRRRELDPQLTAELNEFLFKLFHSAPSTSPGLLDFMHEISPITSAQLTHIQAANVASSVALGDWDRVCLHLRFLNEQGNSDVLVSAPLLADLMSLLVFVVNTHEGLEFAQRKETMTTIHKFVQDCLSTSYGSFPFVSKKRKLVFSLSHLAAEGRRFAPNESLRLLMFESLSTRYTESESLLDVACKLEDILLSLCCEHTTLPPCFDDEFPVPFWDGYVDFVRMAKVHALGYPLETALKLIEQREFVTADRLLSHFNQLRPLAVYLCWDKFSQDADSREALLEGLWKSYLRSALKAPRVVEDAVWLLYRRFKSALLVTHFNKQSGVLSDIIKQLPVHSLLHALRPALPLLTPGTLVAAVSDLPPASTRESRTREWHEAEFDLDLLKCYFALRLTMGLVVKSQVNQSLVLAEIDQLLSAIDRVDLKVSVLEKILSAGFSTLALTKRTPNERFIVSLGVIFSLVCLVAYQATTENTYMQPVLQESQKLLIRILLRLRESLCVTDHRSCVSPLREWANIVNGDQDLASRCDGLRSSSSLWSDLPAVTFEPKKTASFVSPPRGNLQLIPERFVPRIASMADSDQVHTALAMNDFALASHLVRFFGLCPSDHNSAIASGQAFHACRDAIRECPEKLPVIADIEDNVNRILFLVDLAICGNAAPEVALNLLRETRGEGPLGAWTSKLAVLLEAKTEFSSNMSSTTQSDKVTLSELILGIETLPSEPELLKDHLNRMHSQRSAIMALVNRVDQMRRGQLKNEEEDNVADFLSEAISRLSAEEGGLASGSSSFLIRFLEYLGRVCSLVQGAAPTAVSFFDILSVEPIDLVARLVFEHSGFQEAAALCQLMHMDLLSVVESQSCPLHGERAKYFITLEIIQQLSEVERSVLLCVERRTERWPSSPVLDYGIAISKNNPSLQRWIEDRKSCWDRFVSSFEVLYGRQVSLGFTVEEQALLDQESLLALDSVASDTQPAMDALARMVALAYIKKGEYIAALDALDEGLSSQDDPLCKEALLGCLTVNCNQLSPEQIYELLWRVEDTDQLLNFTMGFYKGWDSDVALRALSLCAQRLKPGEALDHVSHQAKVIETMSAVMEALESEKWNSWQRLADIDSPQEYIEVISALIQVHHHSLACEFLDLNPGLVGEAQLDIQADRIELSRLKYIFLSRKSGDLLDRFQQVHHPLKASRLAMQLMASIDSIRERIRLGRLLVANQVACEEDAQSLETQIAALSLLKLTKFANIKSEWNDLLGRPDLIFESLLMNGHTEGVASFLEEFRSWRNDELVLALAAKAIRIGEIGVQSSAVNPRDIGLGGPWSLSGNTELDARIRCMHEFERKPDMPLALRLLALVNPDSAANAEAIFSFANKLSRFINHTGKDSGCPFRHFEYLRQAILALLKLVRQPTLERAVKNGSSNIRLISELWEQCGLQVGLADLSDLTIQCRLRDQLIAMDALDLAERVCYANGRDSEEAQGAADVVTIQRAVLYLKLNKIDRARETLEAKLNCRTLTRHQLRQLEEAVRSRPEIRLEDLEAAHKVLLTLHADEENRCPVIDFDALALKVRKLLPIPVAKKQVQRFTILTHMKGDCPPESGCSQAMTEDRHDVCIQTPTVEESLVLSEPSGKPNAAIDELLLLFDRYGTIGDCVGLLIREGRVSVAIERILDGMDENSFVHAVACALEQEGAKASWMDVLEGLRNSGEPATKILTYLSAIERFLRQSGQFNHVYAYEVSMAREAQAGIVAVQLYLRANSWESRLGWLESAYRHLSSALCHKASRRFVQRQRLRRQQQGALSSSEEDEEELIRQDERRRILSQEMKISVPFNLPTGDLLTESAVLTVRNLVEMERQAVSVVPNAPGSASLFGSIQAVSELIDFLLMEGHVGMAKSIVARLKLPDSVLCGIF